MYISVCFTCPTCFTTVSEIIYIAGIAVKHSAIYPQCEGCINAITDNATKPIRHTALIDLNMNKCRFIKPKCHAATTPIA